MDRSDADRARRGRPRESVVVVANARLVRRERAEKRVEHPNPKRIIVVNESNRIESNRVRAQFGSRVNDDDASRRGHRRNVRGRVGDAGG